MSEPNRRVPMFVWQSLLAIARLLAWEWGAASKRLDPFFFKQAQRSGAASLALSSVRASRYRR